MMPQDLQVCLEKIANANNSDIFLFNAEISYQTTEALIEKIQAIPHRKPNISLMLTTYGGDPDAGYRVMRMLQSFYVDIYFYIFGYCKSAGTLMALGAKEIIMGSFGELGPLDTQLIKDDELLQMSGMNYIQSFLALNEQLELAFKRNFINLKQESNNTITTKTAADVASKLAIGLISPISAQIDPIKLGEVVRAIKIAEAYGKRLNQDVELVRKLITGYPSHGFVIDLKEASSIFSNVRGCNENEKVLEILPLIIGNTRQPKPDAQIFNLLDPKIYDTDDEIDENNTTDTFQ